ncbi:hypothetical protein DSN00_25285 [Salmonella enterica subsp. enterica]|nr:hypothetical protein [Salmonella enterica subsp. enterica serovar Montevideo]
MLCCLCGINERKIDLFRSKDLLYVLKAAHVADRVFTRCEFILLFFSLLRGHPSRESV